MVEKTLRDALANPTVESLTQALIDIVSAYKRLEARCEQLERENERLRRQLNNNSKNSSKPPSTDQKPSKAANTYNSRKKSERKKGAQTGHAGKTLSKEDAQALINTGKAEHRIQGIGMKSDNYRTRYIVDMETRLTVTELRFYYNKYVKSSIHPRLSSPVTYGPGIRALCTLLYSEGVVSNDRIKEIINSMSDGLLSLSEGTVYNLCNSFVPASTAKYESIRANLSAAPVVATDATVTSIDGVQKYIRNFSTDTDCLYELQTAKSIACMKESAILPCYDGIFINDHETAIYHFGSQHGECNAHLFRYLSKNTEESGNSWSAKLKSLLAAANKKRRAAMEAGQASLPETYVVDVEARYDAILALGEEQNRNTKGYTARKEEGALLRRLRNYKENHLLFLRDFRVPFTNNMSERDLRKCKNRQKMSGGFRNADGCKMYCKIISVIETWKREGKNLLQEIKNTFENALAVPYATPVYL